MAESYHPSTISQAGHEIKLRSSWTSGPYLLGTWDDVGSLELDESHDLTYANT